jgi:hypothetical protein
MGMQPLPINQINLKYLMIKLMVNWEPSLRSQLKANTLSEWVRDTYKPSFIDKYPFFMDVKSLNNLGDSLLKLFR